MDKVVCLECGKEMTCINNRHLMAHSLTADEYKKKYPGAILRTELVAQKLSKRSIEANKERKGKPRSEKDKIAIREGVAKRFPIKDRSTKQKVSERKISQETKEKISNTLKGRKLSQETKEKMAIARKFRIYKKGRVVSEKTKQLLSMKSTEMWKSKREILRIPMLSRIEESNLQLLNDISENIFNLKCNVCGYIFTRTPQCFQPSKFHNEICDQCFPLQTRSNAEIEIANYIKTILPNEQVITSDWETINPLELDIYIPKYNIAIEYCGLYWHSELAGKHKWYHRKKMELCNEKNIRLITIFEDEWVNKFSLVENMLKNVFNIIKHKIGARKCEVIEISSEIANAFLNENHLQGSGRSNIRYGLYYKSELISVMTFSNLEISRRLNGWEINRFCTKQEYMVNGAASKLFKKFIKDVKPEKVISYADLRWGTGNVYRHLGFKDLGKTVPNYWYFRNGEMKRYHRYGLRKKHHDPKDLTEWEIRQKENWNRIWDCGHSKWLWESVS